MHATRSTSRFSIDFDQIAALALTLVAFSIGVSPITADSKYQTAEEAYAVGVAFLSQRNYAASQEPLEAAVELAPNDAARVKYYEALIPAYRLLPQHDRFFTAADFVIRHAEHQAKKSLTRRSLIAFAYQRGQLETLIRRYEAALEEDDSDRAALYVLSEVYSNPKRDPERAAKYVERLAKLDQDSGEPLDVAQSASLATQYVRAKKYQEGALLFEQIAPLDKSLEAWHWKEAATAWLNAGDKKRAKKAARQAHNCEPEKRSELLTHFWHRGVADALLATGEAELAIPHYKAAIENTNIDGYIKGCRESLAQAEARVR